MSVLPPFGALLLFLGPATPFGGTAVRQATDGRHLGQFRRANHIATFGECSTYVFVDRATTPRVGVDRSVLSIPDLRSIPYCPSDDYNPDWLLRGRGLPIRWFRPLRPGRSKPQERKGVLR